MIAWFSAAYSRLIDWLIGLFGDLVEFITDVFLIVFNLFLDGIAGLIVLIPVPDFLGAGLNPLFQALDPAVIYFLDMSGVSDGLLLLAAGLAFRLTRKLVTLGQW